MLQYFVCSKAVSVYNIPNGENVLNGSVLLLQEVWEQWMEVCCTIMMLSVHASHFVLLSFKKFLSQSWVLLAGSSYQMRDEDMIMPKRPRRDSPSAFKSHTPSPTPSIKSESSSRSRKSDESESDTEMNDFALEIMDEINCTMCKLVLILSLFCWHILVYSSLHSRVSFLTVQVLHKKHLYVTSIVEKLFIIHTLPYSLTSFTLVLWHQKTFFLHILEELIRKLYHSAEVSFHSYFYEKFGSQTTL